jgi:hypothetical protein
VRTYPSFIAGLPYRAPDGTDRAVYCATFKPGTELILVPEPDNPHDDNAVALWHAGRHVGYIPSKHSWVAAAIKEGDTLHCTVSDIARDVNGRAERVGLRIAIIADGDLDEHEDEIEDDDVDFNGVAVRQQPIIREVLPESAAPVINERPLAKRAGNGSKLLLFAALLVAIAGGVHLWAGLDGLKARKSYIGQAKAAFARTRPDVTIEPAGWEAKVIGVRSDRMTEADARAIFQATPKEIAKLGFRAVSFTDGRQTWRFELTQP